MKTLRLQNYRRFDDTGIISIKPLTLLIGANSSGKSSFLKFFPLLRQTTERHPNGVFLWYSEDVDFKDFKNTVKDGKGAITISFEIDDSVPKLSDYLFSKAYITMEISANSKGRDYLSMLNIKGFNGDCDITIRYSSILGRHIEIEVNGEKKEYKNKQILVQNNRTIIPTFYFSSDDELLSDSPPESENIIENLISDENGAIPVSGIRILRRYITTKEGFINKVLPLIKSNNKNDQQWNIIYNHYLRYRLVSIINDLNSYLFNLSSSIHYIQPLRASAQRFYRIQNIAVDEVDSHGDNLAMYLNSLSNSKRTSLNNWLYKHFKFKLDIVTSIGHVELRLKEDGQLCSRNLVDLGFGYSQLLPIIISIWNSLEGKSLGRNHRLTQNFKSGQSKSYIVIEQPELHLHPNLIARFADMLAVVISLSSNFRFIIETHSETLINRIGELIANSNYDTADSTITINSSDVDINLFNATSEGFEAEIHHTGYDSDGNLVDWPFGFFSGNVY